MAVFLGIIAVIALIWLLAVYVSLQNQLVDSEGQVAKHYADMEQQRRSAQDLLNDYIISISSYAYEERQSLERHYDALERMVRMGGFGGGALINAAAAPDVGFPTRLMDLYKTRMREVSSLHARFNESYQRYTAAMAHHHSMRWRFPLSLLPNALVGQAHNLPRLNHDIPFIDIEKTKQLIDLQRRNLVA